MEKNLQAKNKSKARKFLGAYMLVIELVVLCVIMALASPKFMDLKNWMNILLTASYSGLVAVGMTFVIITGGIDLSVGSVLAFASMMGAYAMTFWGFPLPVAIIFIIVVGMLIGAAQGWLVSRLNMPAFIVTLAGMSLFRGFTLVVSGAKSIPNLPAPLVAFGNGKISDVVPIPFPVILLIGVFIIGFYILKYTSFGRGLYALGGNREATKLSGLNVKNIEMGAFIISGITAALAGIVTTSRLGTALPTAGDAIEMQAIGAAVIGGASLAGGVGTMLGTFIGVLILGILNNGINLIGVDPLWQQVVSGAVILVAVLIDTLKNRGNKAD